MFWKNIIFESLSYGDFVVVLLSLIVALHVVASL